MIQISSCERALHDAICLLRFLLKLVDSYLVALKFTPSGEGCHALGEARGWPYGIREVEGWSIFVREVQILRFKLEAPDRQLLDLFV